MRILKVMAIISFGMTSPKWLQLSRLQHMSIIISVYSGTPPYNHLVIISIFFQPKHENHRVILLFEDPLSNVMTSLL